MRNAVGMAMLHGKKEIVQPNSKQYGEFLAVKKRQGK